MAVNNLVEIEEASVWNTRFNERVEALAAIVWEEPCGANWNSAWEGRDLSWGVLLQCLVELLWGDQVVGEGSYAVHLEECARW